MKHIFKLLVVLLLVLTTTAFTFTDGPKKAAPGTYQIVIKNTKKQYVYTDEFYIMVESKRQDHQEVTIVLNPDIAVIIPSRDQIQAPDFKPLAEFFYK